MEHLFIGDSITCAHRTWDRDDLGDGFVRMIAEECPDARVINKGFDGFTLRRLLTYVKKMPEDKEDPTTITLLIGVNDLAEYLYGGGYDATIFKGYLDDMVRWLTRFRDSKVIFLEPFLLPWPAEYQRWLEPLGGYQNAMEQTACEHNYTYVKTQKMLHKAMNQMRPQDLTTDGIHLTATGHRLLADAWLDSMGLSERSNHGTR
ncbi:MAG: SGNH/GDSL hydrolase family protein [Eubacterium sp.]|nr:SGNH/GDSL hydrolase family protein [Eubacterium sp.]